MELGGTEQAIMSNIPSAGQIDLASNKMKMKSLKLMFQSIGRPSFS